MASWIYIFSKFTPEALLFEALAIFLLLASYAAFWILRKRKLGAVDQEVPASIVKLYLSELIGEAQDMRAQLFGLMGGGTLEGARKTHAHLTAALGTGANGMLSGAGSADDVGKLSALEAKMAEQALAMDRILTEKAKLEKDLAEAKLKGSPSAPSAAGGANPEDLHKLQDKVQGLEARLAEYSVIEDDLANLKRLQQENAQLKANLAGQGGKAGEPAVAQPAVNTPKASKNNASGPSVDIAVAELAESAADADGAASTATAAQSKKAAKTTQDEAGVSAKPEPNVGPLLEEPLSTNAAAADAFSAETSAPQESAAAAPPAVKAAGETPFASAADLEDPVSAPEAAATDSTFEGLVDEVEKSLQKPEEAKAAGAKVSAPDLSAAPAAAEAKASPKKPANAPVEKSDEDLIAEFEKMLSS